MHFGCRLLIFRRKKTASRAALGRGVLQAGTKNPPHGRVFREERYLAGRVALDSCSTNDFVLTFRGLGKHAVVDSLLLCG